MLYVKFYQGVIILLLSCLCLCSCKNDMNSKLESMYSKSVTLNLNKMEQLKNNENDSIFELYNKKNAKYDLIVFYDSLECMTCITNKMHDWNKLIQNVDSLYGSVRFLFIFSPKESDQSNIMASLRFQKFKYAAYLDRNGILRTENNFIPEESMYHTFLIEGDSRKIVLVGDPRRSDRLMKMFYDILDEKNKCNDGNCIEVGDKY